MAWCTRQCRKPTWEKESYQAHSRRCRCLCGLLVSHSGKGLPQRKQILSILCCVVYFNVALQVILVIKSVDKFPLTTATIMLQITSHILAYTNSCVNPILYAFLSDHFRKSFRKIIYCRPRPEPINRLGPATRTTRAASTGDIL